MDMKHLELFEEWISSATIDDYKIDYKGGKDKVYYGVHEIELSRGNKSTKVKSKFDTGARSSSIDFNVAERLGLSSALISECRRLSLIKISKKISKKEQK